MTGKEKIICSPVRHCDRIKTREVPEIPIRIFEQEHLL
jgi:hypothetical protein